MSKSRDEKLKKDKKRDEDIDVEDRNTSKKSKSDILIEELEKKILELNNKVEEKDREFLTKLAEVENMKKRFEKSQETFKAFANEKLILGFLDVLDNFERALSSEGDIREGVEMISSQFLTLLEKEGVTVIQTKEFNPNLHYAISKEKGSQDRIEEIRKGYKLKDRVIRPTMVKIIEKEKEEA